MSATHPTCLKTWTKESNACASWRGPPPPSPPSYQERYRGGLLCLWLTHGEARGGGRRAAAWRPPPRVSLFFYLQVGLGGISEGGRPAAHATGLGDGAPALPFPLACVVGRLSLVKKARITGGSK